MPQFTVAQLAEICSGVAQGELSRVITGANSLSAAIADQLSFVAGRKAQSELLTTRAGCLLIGPETQIESGRTVIRVADPRSAFAKALRSLYPDPLPAPGVHPTAIVSASAVIGLECSIGAYSIIGENVLIGDHCVIGPRCQIDNGAHIGPGSRFFANVTVYAGVQMGSRAVVHSGAVIGADGFGFAFVEDHYEKFPQIGKVVIGDDVEIGANTCIDRAALGVTKIGNGTKLDNLIHIAHNCAIGEHVAIAAQAGFSGSVTVGDYAVIGGQAGIGEKAMIAAKAMVGGKAGIITSQRVPAGEPVWGIPARPLRQHLKGLANIARLDELKKMVQELRRKVDRLEQPANDGSRR